MPGTRLLSYLQLGKETTKGTAVAATFRLSPDLDSAYSIDWMKTYHEGRATGYRNPVSYATQQGQIVAISYRTPDDTGIAFDELPYFLHFPQGGTAGTGSTAVTWGWAWGGTATGTALAYTIEFGDDTQEFEAEYCQVRHINIRGSREGMTTLSADIFGRQSTKSTKTTLATVDDVRIPGYLWTLSHATAASGLAAASVIPNFLREWEADWDTGLVPHFYNDGTAVFGQSVESAPVTGTVRLVVDSNSTAITQYYDKGAAGTVDFARLKATGPVIAGGTAYSALFEFGLEYTNVQPLGSEIDGVNTYEIEARIVSDATWGQAIGSTVVCNQTAL